MDRIENTEDLSAGQIVLSGTGYYLVQGTSKRSFLGRLWDAETASWGTSRDVPLPSPTQSACIVPPSYFPMESVILIAGSYGITDKSTTAHIRGYNGSKSYCGRLIQGSVPEGGWVDGAGYHTGQHCVECDRQYRILNHAVAVTYDF